MARVITAWGFGAAFLNITSGAIYVAFARQIGANDFVFGLLAAALPLMSFLQVLSARLLERLQRRKLQMLTAGFIGRSLWIVAALLPLVSRQWPELLARRHVLPLIVGCVLLSGACQAFTTPAFFSWIADLIPGRVRPTFLARRMQIGTCVSLVMALGSGWIADNFPSLTVYCVLLALAGVAGLLDIAFFLGVTEPPANASSIPTSLSEAQNSTTDAVGKTSPDVALPSFFASLREPLRDGSIRTFLLFAALLTFSYGAMGPFLWLHMREVLGYNNVVTGLILNVAPILGVICTSRFWGGVIKRHGNRPVMRMGSFGMLFMPLVWLTPAAQWAPALALFLFGSGVLFCALELCNQNLITGLSPHVPRSTLTALFAIASGTSFALASCLGGRVAQWLAGSQFHLLGMTLVNYHVLFGCALLVRLINTTFVAPRLREPESTGTMTPCAKSSPKSGSRWPASSARSLQDERLCMTMDKSLPRELDGAKVLYVSIAGSPGLYGVVHCADEKRDKFIAALAVCQYHDGNDVYVFACGTDWKVLGDLCFESVEEAMAEAERYYSESPVKWEEVD